MFLLIYIVWFWLKISLCGFESLKCNNLFGMKIIFESKVDHEKQDIKSDPNYVFAVPYKFL